MDASEIYTKRLNAKEVIFHKEKGDFIFPVADGRIKPLGGDQELRTPTLIREYPIRGEGYVDCLGEPEGSLPPPQDSLPDAGEATNDFWSMSGNLKNRHHVEPRVKLYSPREESFPIPLKYIDVSRTTHTVLSQAHCGTASVVVSAWLALSGASACGFVFPGSHVGFPRWCSQACQCRRFVYPVAHVGSSTLAFAGFLLRLLISLAPFSVCGRDDHQESQQVSQPGEEGRLSHVSDQHDCSVFAA